MTYKINTTKKIVMLCWQINILGKKRDQFTTTYLQIPQCLCGARAVSINITE